MNCRNKLLLISLFLLGSHLDLLARTRLDSLLSELPNAKNDSQKVILYHRIANEFGDKYPDESMLYARKELALGTTLKWKQVIAGAYCFIGVSVISKDDRKHVEALRYLDTALNIFEDTRDTGNILGTIDIITGIYDAVKIYDSLLYFNMLRLRICELRKDTPSIVNALLQTSYAFKLKRNYRQSLSYGNKCLLWINAKDEFKSMMPAVKGVMGEAYLGLAEGGVTGKPHTTYIDSAARYLEIGVADNEKLKNISNAIHFSKALAECLILKNDYKRALEVTRHGNALQDSLNSEKEDEKNEVREKLVQMNEAQLALEQKQIENDRIVRWLFVAGIVLLVLLVLFVIRNYYLQKRANVTISAEKNEIQALKNEIQEKHFQTIESVNYARRIQSAILPPEAEIGEHFADFFVLYMPKDIVSGDFYWLGRAAGKTIIAAIDCTGHGVPGAMMSMIGNTLLNSIVIEKGITDPATVLDLLDKEVNNVLKQNREGASARDGMDVALCVFDHAVGELMYAGANRALYHFFTVPGGMPTLAEYKPTKFPIGGFDVDHVKNFSTSSVSLAKGDRIYLFTDGYPDQFGGEKGKKLMTGKFKSMLVQMQGKSMAAQKVELEDFFRSWKGSLDQVDDVLVVGVEW